jgi:hypothetical protein
MLKDATLLWGGMSERFLKFIPSEEAFWLMQYKPNAFRLLSHIANTARRYNGHPDGLIVGQCHLQSWNFYGLSEQEYRTAKSILLKRKHIIIIETNRTRKKSTTGATTNSTLVQLCSLTIWDINSEEPNDRINDRATTEQRPSNDKQERIRKDISNDISNEEEALRAGTHPASPIRAKDLLIFNFEKWEFEGITEQDLADWKLMYPHIDIKVETLKASQWLKNNPSKSNKKQWRKYLTGWYGRSNDSIENKKAYRSATGGATQDRRTKNKDGTPISSRAEDLF